MKNTTPKVIILNEERIFTSTIKTYSIKESSVTYRNDVKLKYFKNLFSDDGLYDEYKFKYLYIEFYNGKRLSLYSDVHINELLAKAEIKGSISGDLNNIKDNFTIVNEEINEIIKKIDSAFIVL